MRDLGTLGGLYSYGLGIDRGGVMAATWRTVIENIPGTGSEVEVLAPAASNVPRQFFRLSRTQ